MTDARTTYARAQAYLRRQVAAAWTDPEIQGFVLRIFHGTEVGGSA
jgi:hypothetical protein